MTTEMVSAGPSRSTSIIYWLATLVIVFVFAAGGVGDLSRAQPVIEGMTHLGYPVYFCVILGIWKVLGAIAIIIPRTALLKEWAYAGIVFDLTGAAASHFAIGDPPDKIVTPLIFTVVAFVSWGLRPASRR